MAGNWHKMAATVLEHTEVIYVTLKAHMYKCLQNYLKQLLGGLNKSMIV